MHNLGCEYSTGEHLEQDLNKAFDLFKAAAEKGYVLAMRTLGHSYEFGYGCAVSMKNAIECYEKVLEKTEDAELEEKIEAMKQMAEADPDWSANMEIQNSHDPVFLKKKADEGNARAQAKYGGMLLTDDDNPDYEEGFRYVSMSAEKGYEEGMMLLGACFHRGIGTEQDLEKAIEWYEKCVEMNPGNVDIIRELGRLYLDKDEDLPIDNLRISVEYYERAGELGDDSAAYFARLWGYVLSVREKGIMPGSVNNPVEWVVSHAENGDVEAQIAVSGSTERWKSFDCEKWEHDFPSR